MIFLVGRYWSDRWMVVEVDFARRTRVERGMRLMHTMPRSAKYCVATSPVPY